jgi:hypothetical protein
MVENNELSNVLNIMKDLQPVAFLLSMSLVIAAFYTNPSNNVDNINLTYVLMSSIFFFFAYAGLFFLKITEFRGFLYFGESSVIAGMLFIMAAFSGIIELINNASLNTNTLLIYILVYSFFLILTIYMLGIAKHEKTHPYYKMFLYVHCFCKKCFYLSLLLFFGSITLLYFKSLPLLLLYVLNATILVSLSPMIFLNKTMPDLFNPKSWQWRNLNFIKSNVVKNQEQGVKERF